MKQGSWPRFMEKYGVDYTIVQRRPVGGGFEMGVMFEAMDWPMVYLDGISCIYVKPGTLNEKKTK